MDTAAARSTHPLVIIAALAVTLFCLVGIAALMGWLPSSKGDQAAATAAAPASVTEAKKEAAVPEKRAAVEPPESPARRAQRPARAASRPAAPASVNTNVPEQVAPRAEPPVQVAAAETPPPAPAAPVAAEAPKPVCRNCGVVEAVRTIQKEAPASGLGAAAGGILGGVVGHQLGSGRGRDVATVVGAVGGAVAGHEVEKRRNQSVTYETTVRFDDGTTQHVTQQEAPAWRQGDRVRVVNGSIRLM